MSLVGVRHYRELVCWQLSVELRRAVGEITAGGRAAADRTFCHQIRDATRSAPSNIAEGFARFQHRDFARFLEIARGSLMETHNHLGEGLDAGYITVEQYETLIALADRAIGATTKLLVHLRRKGART
jgi:four helix bundle protein